MVLSKKLPLCLIALTVLEDALQAARGKGHQQFYPVVNPMNMQQATPRLLT